MVNRYRHHSEIVSQSDTPLTGTLRDLGTMPDQVSSEQNKQVLSLISTLNTLSIFHSFCIDSLFTQVLLRLQLQPRNELLGQASQGTAGRGVVNDPLAELRKDLLDCLRLAPTVNLRQNEGLKESMGELLRECKVENKYDAAGKAQRVLDQLDQQGVASSQESGSAFLQQTADEM